ncbi:Uu.00g028850.m01.CDS01 [Anthostomella pinea]|uniref:Uu.00g028850.m01.CDS01 n=1 Tax=Anthostomella pinea TaxID=933095 RepID=A0AAI8V8H6_9PEZI|nr:Uu.00g028850.m01.CDS01 [Anthostomella pinea]
MSTQGWMPGGAPPDEPTPLNELNEVLELGARHTRMALRRARRGQNRDSDSEELYTPAIAGESDPSFLENQTMKCEIKHLDRKYNDKGELYFAERGGADDDAAAKPRQPGWWRLYAFCVVRLFDRAGKVLPKHTRLYINPTPLRALLRDVIGNYPSDPINVHDVQIVAPYYALFHYRKELESVGLKRFEGDGKEKDAEGNFESAAQLRMLLMWIDTHFALAIEAHWRCVNPAGEGIKAITYEYLWTLSPPQQLIHTKVLEQHRVYKVISSSWYQDQEHVNPGLMFTVTYIDYDGDRMGTRLANLLIREYKGSKELCELNAMPLELLDNADDVRAELLARGRRFEAYTGQHFESYDGIAVKTDEKGNHAKFSVQGRIMIDCKTYHRLEPNDSFRVVQSSESAEREKARLKAKGKTGFASDKRIHDPLSDEEACMANATIRGFSFTVKRFLEFFVDNVSPIEWNEQCFDELVLDAVTK